MRTATTDRARDAADFAPADRPSEGTRLQIAPRPGGTPAQLEDLTAAQLRWAWGLFVEEADSWYLHASEARRNDAAIEAERWYGYAAAARQIAGVFQRAQWARELAAEKTGSD